MPEKGIRKMRKKRKKVNYDTLTNDDYTTLNQQYEYKQCYHPTAREIKRIPLLFDLPSYKQNKQTNIFKEICVPD